MRNEWEDDELTAVDLEFLEALETLGRDEHADDAYSEADSEGHVAEGEGSGGLPGENAGEDDSEGAGDPIGEAEGDGEGNPEASDEGGDIDLGELDPSQGTEGNESEGDHLEGGDIDSEIQDGESDLEFDDLDYESPDEGDIESDFDSDEDDPDGGFDDGDDGQQTHFDESESQVEEDDGEGERGNSDEARESDEPIEHKSDSDDAELDTDDDLSEIDESDNDEDSGTHEDQADDDVSDEQKQDPPDDSQSIEHDPEDTQQENQETGIFEGIPESPELCDNHCEDNLEEEHDGECPHCTARLKRERELWGEIATDKNGTPILPGDRLRVVVPVSFMVPGTILTANVPNFEVDPIRVAESTAGIQDKNACWLSGHSVSAFTGWHLIDNGPVWAFKKGKKIRFVEKMAEPEFQGHGSNDMDGFQLDSEDLTENLIDQLKDEMDEELGHIDEPELEDDEQEAEEEEDDAEEDASEDEMDDSETEGSEGEGEDQLDSGDPDGGDDANETGESEEEEHRGSSNLTISQKARFESLTARIIEKVKATFGNTLENIEVTDAVDYGAYITVSATITSRGSRFSMDFTMEKEK
jgi:hypothetical protein